MLYIIFMPMILIIFVLGLFYGIIYFFVLKYKVSEYYRMTKIPYFKMLSDVGAKGEYFTYKVLNEISGKKKFLFNVYIPKKNGETTEVDLIMINKNGIFVFESKNYSGWIFGQEADQNWTQTLPLGRGKSYKSKFFNPIKQNDVHIKWLKEYLREYSNVPVYSYIVFSNRCELKSITLTGDKNRVVKRNELSAAIRSDLEKESFLDESMINEIYNKLYSWTQVDEKTKTVHIDRIKQRYKSETIQSRVCSDEKAVAENKSTEFYGCSNFPKCRYTEEIKETDDKKICPKCSGELVLRTVKKGENKGSKFYGCLNFPKCRYTEKIEETDNKRICPKCGGELVFRTAKGGK